MRSMAIAGALAVGLAPLSWSQGVPEPQCPGPLTVNSYKVRPIPSTFTSIRGLPGVVRVFNAPADDLTSPAIPLPYPFNYFRTPVNSIFINTNGFIATIPVAGSTFTNKHPGDGETPNSIIMAWHDDLILTVPDPACPGGSVWAGPDTAGIFTVEWQNVKTWSGAGTGRGCFSFQAKLYPRNPGTALSDAIEFHYRRASTPQAMGSCQVSAGGPSSFAVSATVGVEGVSAAGAAPLGCDATERGAGNEDFPNCGIRLLPALYTITNENASGYYTMAPLPPPVPFCHIDNLPGSVPVLSAAGTANCGAGLVCMDDERSARLLGDLIDLPWKFTMYARPTKNVNMNSNGHVAFGPGQFPTAFGNVALPAVADPDLTAYALWDDLEGIMPLDNPPPVPFPPGVPPTSLMWYRVDGLPGARVMTFEWHDVHTWLSPGRNCQANPPHASMQVLIHEGSAGGVAPGACPYPVAPGVGNDRIEFRYDRCSPTGFTATVGIENATGTAAHALPAAATCPGPIAFERCDGGLATYYGDPSNSAGPIPLCRPEIKGNCVPPIIGNPFGIQMVGASPGVPAFLLLDFGGTLPGLRTPVPPGGLPVPGIGILWVSPPLFVIGVGPTTPGGPCQGCKAVEFLLPPDPTLVRSVIFAQFATVQFVGGAIMTELTEGMKIHIGL